MRENAFARVRGRSARSLPALPARNRPEMSSEDVIDERGEHGEPCPECGRTGSAVPSEVPLETAPPTFG